jgi:2-keto-4-pentenoate hydratase
LRVKIARRRTPEALADLLAEARREVRQVRSLLDDLVPHTAAEAYAVNDMVTARLGWETLGWKIAGTTAEVREKLALETPIYGRTFRQFAAQSPVRLQVHQLLDPLVECEFFVTLVCDLLPREKTLVAA